MPRRKLWRFHSARRFSVTAGFYRACVVDSVPRHSPAEHVRRPAVPAQLAAILRDTDGNQAVLHTTLCSDTPTTAVIAGTRATLTLPGPFCQPGDVILTPAGGTRPAGI